MKINWKLLAICIAVPLFIGFLSAFFSQNSMEVFTSLNQPPLSPPGWVFPIVWTILYVLMGMASYLVLTSGTNNNHIQLSMWLYGLQLFMNFFWSILFFNQGMYLVAFIWLVLLWGLLLITTLQFYKLSKLAGYLMIPYLIWVTFAGYLNLAIYLIN